MEAFFSSLKSELGEHFESPGDAKRQLFDYIEVFYNQRRRHSTLGLISPAEYERHAAAGQIARPAPTRPSVPGGGIVHPGLDRDRGSWSLL